MRYPIDKDLTPNKDSQHHFDYFNFVDRMNDLCGALRQLDYELSNQMDESALIEELTQYIEVYEKYQEQINDFLELLKEDMKEEGKSFKASDFFSGLKDYSPPKYLNFLNSCDSDLLILLENLYYAGRCVREQNVRLSQSMVEKQKEFVRLCNNLLTQDGLKFGETHDDSQINIWGKTSSSLFANISEAISVLTLIP